MNRGIFLVLLALLSGCASGPPVPALHQRILDGDAAGAKALIERREGINVSDERGNTPLHLAVLRDRVDLVESLIIAGAELDYRNNSGSTPLIVACRKKTSAMATLLVERGARIEPAYKGFNAFSEAVRHGHTDLVTLFVGKGANREVRNHFGETPLFYAVQFGNEEMIRLLIKNGANVNSVADDGRTVLHVAAMKQPDDRKALVDLLLQSGAKVRDAEASEVAFYSTALLYEHLGNSALDRNDAQAGSPYLKKSANYYSHAAQKFEQVASSHEAAAARVQMLNMLSVATAALSANVQAQTQAKQIAQFTPRGQTATGVGVAQYSVRSTEELQSLEARYRALAATCKSASARLMSVISCIEAASGQIRTCRS